MRIISAWNARHICPIYSARLLQMTRASMCVDTRDSTGAQKKASFCKIACEFFYVISVTFSTLVREVSKQRWFPDQVVIAFLCLLWISHSKITWYPLDIIQREIAKKMWRHTSQFFRREPILKTSFVIFLHMQYTTIIPYNFHQQNEQSLRSIWNFPTWHIDVDMGDSSCSLST